MALHHARGMDIHEHHWTTVSRHLISTGMVIYLRCECGRVAVEICDAATARSAGRVLANPATGLENSLVPGQSRTHEF